MMRLPFSLLAVGLIGWLVAREGFDTACISITLFLIAALLFAFADVRAPEKSDVVRRAKRWGELGEVSRRMEAIYTAPQSLSIGKWRYADGYLIKRGLFSFNVLRTDTLLLAYKYRPEDAKDVLTLRFAIGDEQSIEGSRIQVDGLFDELKRTVPNLWTGGWDEMSKINSKSNEGLIRLSSMRRRIHAETGQWPSMQVAAPEEWDLLVQEKARVAAASKTPDGD